jgi:hypothetical protein
LRLPDRSKAAEHTAPAEAQAAVYPRFGPLLPKWETRAQDDDHQHFASREERAMPHEGTPITVKKLGHVVFTWRRAKTLEEAVANPLPGVTYR